MMAEQARVAGEEALGDAVDILKRGGLVAFPTETVYGLGADACNPAAVRRIFAVKQRPTNHPLIVHLAAASQLTQWTQAIPDVAWRLAEQFWPGPLAMILPRHPDVPLAVTGGQQTIALRIPDNPLALALLRQFGGGIAAPSANRFNHVSPTQAAHVLSEIGDRIELILDGGNCRVGLESTIVNLSGREPQILRPGHITAEQIADVIGQKVCFPSRVETRAPGTLALHYAPETPSVLCTQSELLHHLEQCLAEKRRVGILSCRDYPQDEGRVYLQKMPDDPVAYAHDLYVALRQLDQLGLDTILVDAVPDDENWLAVNDRLRKATAAARV